MTQEWIEGRIQALALEKGISLQDIPDIDLYMDQLITLFENKLQHTKRHEGDKLLTKTMINNYTKDKVIMPAQKKKYTREHIMLMSLLYQFKSIVSLGDIKELFSLVKDEECLQSEKFQVLFEAYQVQKKNERQLFCDGVHHRIDTISTYMKEIDSADEDVEVALLVATLLEQANYHKRLAESVLDAYCAQKNVEE